jgi:hypothetical protein
VSGYVMWPKKDQPPDWFRDLMREAFAVAVTPLPREIPRIAYWPPHTFVWAGPLATLDLGLPSALAAWELGSVLDDIVPEATP